MIKNLSLLFCITLLCFSCASEKKLLYLQNANLSSSSENITYANVLQPDDNLVITVTSDVPELANPFNLMYLNMRSTEVRTMNNETLYSYLIDQNGEIDFPVLGKLKLAGLTRIQAEDKIKKLLEGHLRNPGVNLRVLNFKVSVLGEVARPSVHNVIGDRITLLEAISMSGDMTIYGKRKEVMIIREVNGQKTVSEIDITNDDFVNSPYYYLKHNDVVYVKPNKTRINSSSIGPNITVGLSALSLLITIITLSIR